MANRGFLVGGIVFVGAGGAFALGADLSALAFKE